jgi:hypothetical protein
MKKQFLLLIILTIFIVSAISFFLILNYMDPYVTPKIAVSFLVITFFLWLSSFVSLLIYFVKKIHYRWDVFIFHIRNSFRQAVFFSLFVIGSIVFYIFNASMIVSVSLLFILFLFLELFIGSLKS